MMVVEASVPLKQEESKPVRNIFVRNDYFFSVSVCATRVEKKRNAHSSSHPLTHPILATQQYIIQHPVVYCHIKRKKKRKKSMG